MTGIPVSQVLAGGLDEFRVFELPRQVVTVVTCQERQVENHLTKAVFGVGFAQLLQEFQELATSRVNHGNASPILGVLAHRPFDFTDNFDPDANSGCEPGNSCRSCHTIVNHQFTIGPAIHPWRRHSGGPGAEPSNLGLKLERVRATSLRRQEVQVLEINVEEFRWPHASSFYSLARFSLGLRTG
jgi:hypothetical protein